MKLADYLGITTLHTMKVTYGAAGTVELAYRSSPNILSPLIPPRQLRDYKRRHSGYHFVLH